MRQSSLATVDVASAVGGTRRKRNGGHFANVSQSLTWPLRKPVVNH
jgi:hypothetical protein